MTLLQIHSELLSEHRSTLISVMLAKETLGRGGLGTLRLAIFPTTKKHGFILKEQTFAQCADQKEELPPQTALEFMNTNIILLIGSALVSQSSTKEPESIIYL